MQADLSVGADVAGAEALTSNENLSNRGFQVFGAGFIVTLAEAQALGLGTISGLERHIRPYRNGRDLTDRPRGALVIDLFGLTAEQVRQHYPALYQHLLERVKPERDNNNRESRRLNWWVWGEPNKKLRSQLAGLLRYVATVETAKHRTFQFLDATIAPDNKLIAVAVNDSYYVGILSSRLHVAWALAAGSWLGVGNDPVYVKSRCFEPYPFPSQDIACNPMQAERIGRLAEELDAHRKRQQAQHPELTLTGMYNALEKLRTGESLTQKERTIHDQGLVSVLRELHDDLYRAVFDAYGWNDLAVELVGKPGATTPLPDKPAAQAAAEEELLLRLVKLNAERAAEEARGLIRWLRPEDQQKAAGIATAVQTEIETEEGVGAVAIARAPKRAWPKDAPGQAKALADLLAETPAPLSLDDIAAKFNARGRWRERLEPMLAMLVVLGKAQVEGEGVAKRYRRPDKSDRP